MSDKELAKILFDRITNDEIFRIKKGERVNSIGVPYNLKYIRSLIKMYIVNEDYETCDILNNYIHLYLSDLKHDELFNNY